MDVLKRSLVLLTTLSVAHQAAVLAAEPVGTTITYQGQLKEAGVPLNGNVDLQFELFDAEFDGNPIGSPLLIEDVPIVKGLFSVELDFGAAAFTGDARWAQIEVQVPQDAGGTLVVPLSPRQPLTATPYSLFSLAPWQQTGADVSYTDGNVGIGTSSPSAKLDVVGTTELNGEVSINSGLTVDTDTLFVDGSGGNVGIGTSSPSAKLDVVGTTELNGDVSISNGLTVGTDTLFVDGSGGNVGIGTSSPSAKLDVAGTIRATEAIVDGFVTITRPDISGTVALRLDIGRLWVFRQVDSGAGGKLELASLNSQGISNKDFIVNTNGDTIIKGGLQVLGDIDIGYEIVEHIDDGDRSEAICPQGKRVIGGGCKADLFIPDTIQWSAPLEDGSGWVCIYDTGVFGGNQITAYAICANIR